MQDAFYAEGSLTSYFVGLPVGEIPEIAWAHINLRWLDKLDVGERLLIGFKTDLRSAKLSLGRFKKETGLTGKLYEVTTVVTCREAQSV